MRKKTSHCDKSWNVTPRNRHTTKTLLKNIKKYKMHRQSVGALSVNLFKSSPVHLMMAPDFQTKQTNFGGECT